MNESCTIKPLPLFKGERRTYRGILQPFADHAHGHYVFGIVREGERELVLNGKLLRIKKGDILVFNAGDAHGCTQVSESPFAYDSFTVAAEILDGERFDFPSNTDDLPRKQLEEVFSLLDRCREEDALEAFVAFEQTLVAKPDVNPLNPNTRKRRAPLCAYARASCRETMLGNLRRTKTSRPMRSSAPIDACLPSRQFNINWRSVWMRHANFWLVVQMHQIRQPNLGFRIKHI